MILIHRVRNSEHALAALHVCANFICLTRAHPCTQVLAYLEDNINSDPGALGGPNETSEALAERHQRVLASSLLALGAFAQRMVAAKGAAGATDSIVASASGALRRLGCVVEKAGFWKRVLASKQGPTRRAAYTFMSQLSQW